MQKRQLIRGIIAVASPVPTFYFFSVCGVLPIALMSEIFNHSVPDWFQWIFAPCFLASPILCCVFLVLAIIQRKERFSGLCILLSGLGLIENALWFLILMELGKY